MTKKLSKLEETLALQIRAYKLPAPKREYKFHESRKWRLDFAYPERIPPLAIEVEGGVYTRGRHTRPKGFKADCEKYNTLTLMGWQLLRFEREAIITGEAIDLLREVFNEQKTPASTS